MKIALFPKYFIRSLSAKGKRKFFSAGYKMLYPECSNSGLTPWQHYLMIGKPRGYDNGNHPPRGMFYPEGYLLNYPDVKKVGFDPWQHYVLHGKSEGRNNGLTDYTISMAGHESEAVRAIYLDPFHALKEKLSRTNNIKKVLLIGHDFSVTGAPISLLDIAKILISDGYAVDIAVKGRSNVSEIHIYDGIGADVFILPDSYECFPDAEKAIKNYDLVIVNTVVMAAYAELCKKLNIPHIWFVREDLPGICRYFKRIKSCEQRFLDDYENVVCVSKYVADCVSDNYKIQCRYINNFINDRFSADVKDRKDIESFESRPKTFAVVGSVESRKAQESVVAAFLYLSAKPDCKDKWKLFFIGNSGRNALDPALGVKLQNVTRNVPNVVWCGQVTENKWELFNSIDFFIVPSLEEASSRVAIEAAMLGKPLIATTHVGAKYLTENNAGFLYEPGNAVELRGIVLKCLGMTYEEYNKFSRQIRSNYEQTSSFSVYYKSLSSAIRDASERCRANHEQVKNTASSNSFLRDICSGKNVSSFGSLEYINFIDFSRCSGQTHGSAAGNSASHTSEGAVGVVVPVYNGIEHLKVLIPSLFKNTDLAHKFIFVNDCSNEETSAFLAEAIRGHDDCVLVRNEKNLGFVKSINRGAAKALESCSNFVMLNSDTEVPSGWLSRLMRPIFEDDGISSVTPLSNRCNIFSFPFSERRERNDIFLKEFGLEGINEAIRNSSADRYIDLPTGHGFCMAISGKAWKKLGGLNDALFGRGFGEENEWSLRAELEGFRNILMPGLYVAHHEKGSFTSEEKKANCAASAEIITVMFPSYRLRVQNFIREYPSADSIVSIYLSLAKQRGFQVEQFKNLTGFMERLSGNDGIFVLKTQDVTKIAVKLLGETIFVGNAKNLDKAGVYNS